MSALAITADDLVFLALGGCVGTVAAHGIVAILKWVFGDDEDSDDEDNIGHLDERWQ